MNRENGVGLFWSTLFNYDKNTKDDYIIKRANDNPPESYSPAMLTGLLEIYGDERNDECYVKACEIAALRFCLEDLGLASALLSDEDKEKALQMFTRKNYSSKLLKDLLAKFINLVHICRVSSNIGEGGVEKLKLLLLRDILSEYKALKEEKAEKSFSELKKAIEKIASGVKIECYFDAEKNGRGFRERNVNRELNEFIKEKYGYNLNEYRHLDGDGPSSIIFKRALLDSEKFWEAHGGFGVFTFVDSVRKNNDEKRAQKILSHIFDNIKKHEIGAKLIENNLPLTYIYKERFLEKVKENTFNIAFSRFENAYDLTKIKDEVLCYPLFTSSGIEEKIAKGKDVIEGLFNKVYPDDGNKVLDFFNEQLTTDKPYMPSNRYTVKEMFLSYTFGYWFTGEKSNEYKAARVYCPEYFSAENTWNRFYLTAYAMSVLEENVRKCQANLFELLYSFFRLAEEKFGLKTSFQKDTAGRNEAYLQLKDTLKKYGVEISDNFKDDYITSLLDRKVAVMEEIERFAALEQLGDAVYGFAVAEIMFYQPEEVESDSVLKEFDSYVCAEAQVGVARMLGIDKLYISSLSLSQKTCDVKDDGFLLGKDPYYHNDKYKFLADSLEMVIGTVCKDCGYRKAVEFTKAVLRERNSYIFKKEIRWENRDEVDPEKEVDWEYWNRIFPSPFYPYERSYDSKSLTDRMWDALNKFMLAYSIGTDGVEEREFISHRYSNAESGDELYGENRLGRFDINYAMFDYLHRGLAFVVDKYSAAIKENYKKLKKI